MTAAPPSSPSKQESAISTTSSAVITNINVLVGRELEWAKNSEELLAKHAQANENGSIVRTRFPPEPNGMFVLACQHKVVLRYLE